MESNKPRVLVIEDSVPTSRLVEVCLLAAGLAVATRLDGQTGLEAALESPPDLIVLDLALPVVHGWEVLRRLRDDARTAHVPVLILTAHGSQENKDRAFREEADAFMVKPFAPADIRRQAVTLINATSGHLRGAPVRATSSGAAPYKGLL
jgi:DNA-binding response OmpR family regulator